MMKEKHYDLVLTDIGMPILNGIELYQKASQFIEELDLKIIFHSGNLTSQERLFFQENNLLCLEKPSSILEIEQTIEDRLRQNSVAQMQEITC